MMKKRFLFAGTAAVALASAVAIAQTVSVPTVTTVGTTDLIQIIPNGGPKVGNVYANPAQIAGVPGYQYSVPTTGFSIQANNSTKRIFINPAGTLATGTVLFATSPSDGQEFCIESTQTQTALTVTAATGTSISALAIGAVTALTAGTPVCWFFNKPLATWFRTI